MKTRLTFFSLIILLVMACSNGNTQTNGQSATSIDAKHFAEMIMEHPEAQIIDVRTPHEFNGGYIQGALNLDYNGADFPRQVAALDKNKIVFIYCLSGGRSGSAAKEMRKEGFTQVIELEGGILKWNQSKLPLVKSEKQQPGMSVADFNGSLQNGSIHLIDFYAPWCAPCKKMAPILSELEKEYQGKVVIHRINVDENSMLAEHFKINTLPTFKIFKDGQETWAHQGVLDKQMLVENLKP